MAKKANIRIVRPGERPAYDREKANHGVLRRTTAIMLVCGVLLFLPLFYQLFTLMIVDHDKYESAAISNQTRTTAVPADRGTIYDRNMKIIAASSTVETVFLDPLEIHNAEEDVDFIATELSRILNVDAEMIRKKAAKINRQYEVIATQQEYEVAEQVRQFITDNKLTGIHLEPGSKRHYATPATAAQVVGFVNAENVGADGLEAYYDKLLQGTPGAVITTKGNYQTEMLYSYEKLYEASDGSSLVLTIDAQVQRMLEKNLKAAVEKYDVKNGGFAIMMNVNTGEIVGMAIEGSYDPNNYLEITDLSVLEKLDEIGTEMDQVAEGTDAYKELADLYNQTVAAARLRQWRNRCVSDGYEPGSTFKTITLSAALEEGAVSLDDTWYCGGEAKIERRDQILHCWKATGHGSQTTAQALQNSCNIAFANIGIALGGDKLYEYVKAFGLMEKTGIDLPGEATGYFFSYDDIANPETYASLTSAAFGQTFKVTPIQLVRAIAAVVNGGYVLEPYVVSEILDENGSVLQKNERHVLRQAISEQTSKTMCELMESVVTEGTASNARMVGYAIGGKTGTSEKIDVRDKDGNPVEDKIVSFVGVAPIDDPQYIVLIALDTPSEATGYYISGGVMAAPVVRDVFADILPYLGVTPHYEEEDLHFVNMSMPNVVALNREEAEQSLSEDHLQPEFIGEGDTVTDQIPAPGAEVPGNSTVLIYLGEEKPTDLVTVPDLTGLTQYEADITISNVGGLYLQVRGSTSQSGFVSVSAQSIPAGTEVERGTTVTVELTDASAQD